MDYGILSLLPPIVAILLAIITKRVLLSLALGIFAGELLTAGFNPFLALYNGVEGIIALFKEGWVVKSVIFAALIGSLLALAAKSGGVAAFVSYLTERSKRIKSKRGALVLGYILGIIIFIESTITSLVVGAVTTPLAKRFGASNAKVAYVCDSTSAPVCSLIPLNGWGALIGVLIAGKVSQGVISGEPTEFLIRSIGYNFYAISALLFTLWIVVSGKDFGAMRRAEETAKALPDEEEALPFTTKWGAFVYGSTYREPARFYVFIPFFIGRRQFI